MEVRDKYVLPLPYLCFILLTRAPVLCIISGRLALVGRRFAARLRKGSFAWLVTSSRRLVEEK